MDSNAKHEYCSLKNILTLHLGDINHFGDVLLFILPFANEITNLLTLTIFDPQYNIKLYYHHPKNLDQDIQKTIIDLIALSGILYISAQEAKDTDNILNGFMIGFLYVLFAFSVPNIFMNEILKLVPNNNMIKLLTGVIFIYILEILIGSIMCLYKNYMDKNKKDNKDKKDKKILEDIELVLLSVTILIAGLAAKGYLYI